MLLSSPPRRGCFRLPAFLPDRVRVFPASAGVFPHHSTPALGLLRLPRLGGGVSFRGTLSSPLTRVFPASAGVFPNARSIEKIPESLPRLGGGVSPNSRLAAMRSPVFPASAGVFLEECPESIDSSSLPRLGGGVSTGIPQRFPKCSSSPPRRGCFCSLTNCQAVT